MNKKWHRALIFLVTVVIASLAFNFGLFNRLSDQFTDKLFLKKTVNSHIVIVAIDDESLHSIGAWPWPRQEFAEVLGKLQGAKAIGIDVNFSEPSRNGAADDEKLKEALGDLQGKVVLPIELQSNNKLSTEPLSALSEVTSQGFVNVPVSSDGIVREAVNKREKFSSFSYLLGTLNSSITSGPDNFRIVYRGQAGSYLTFPFSDVSEGRVPSSVFDDNIILIGVTAADLHDILNTPFGLLSGVEVHANILDTLITGKYFHDLSASLVYLFFFLIGLFVFYVVRKWKSLIVLGFSFLIALGLLYGISAYLFTLYIIIPTVYFLFALILSLIVSVAFEYLTESREKKFIRKSFQYYLPEDVVNELVNDPKKLSLGGEARELTILFSDIRGFTTLSEKMSPHELTTFLNDFLTVMSDRIMEQEGLVDKYIGDAIMAFWGAPLPNENHAECAGKGAVAMLHALKELKKKFPDLAIGIGLNTGIVTVGNMGSNKRFNYTVIGDEVNLASRLEGLTKYYKAGCLASETTKKAAENSPDLHFRPLDRVLVKGKKEPRRIYELLAEPLPEGMEKNYNEGLACYERGEWSKAIVSFKKCLEISADGPSETFLERCVAFEKAPPQNWQGVYEFTMK